MVAILSMSWTLVILGLYKIKAFWNKGDEVIISVQDVSIFRTSAKFFHVTQIILYDAVIWPKFGNSGISMKEVIIASILLLDQKNQFFWGVQLV